MKAGVVHCRCSRCYSFPLKRRVHSYLKYLVDNHASVWACASFEDVWPSPKSLKVFERAAERGNFEAAVKLGIAYLYNEGLSISDEGRAEVNGLKASYFFSLAERLNVSADPFIWLFIRPPWSLRGSCCKAVVYESLKAECQVDKAQKGSILYCLAKVLSLFEDEEKSKESLEMFEESSKQGCLNSSYLLWESNRKFAMLDPGRYLQSLRKLRDYATKGCWEAQLTLAKACRSGNHLGLEAKSSNEMVAQMFQASRPISKQSIFAVQKKINETMRYILVDWLVEVATMKDFPCLCLHLTVACVDRYLKLRPVPRYQLQLLGIACMVICTRFHDEAPKDYRQVSLTAVKQRFEDKRYEEVGKEEVFEVENSSRMREDSTQDDRGSIVTTQAVELSTQEESLLDSFLDWSLDSGSGYEGDQESEGEKDGDVTSPSGILDVTVVYVDPSEHCCQDSSDDDTLQKECSGHAAPPRKSRMPGETHRDPACIASRNPNQERSSGYSSVNGTISTSSTEGSCRAPPKPTSAPCLGHAANKKPCLPHYLDSRLQSAWARASDSKSNRRQVKRKNLAEHSEERMNLGFLSL
ncbi:UNVERIFIED_CONTAM: hypothetical protein H355_014758 [Colinus virginianus]|nr:hypothetical protein H355_014758 [Colinus virginianus]